jgi:hypothetical protein
MNENDTIGDIICVTRREGGVERGDPREGGDKSKNERQANADWR